MYININDLPDPRNLKRYLQKHRITKQEIGKTVLYTEIASLKEFQSDIIKKLIKLGWKFYPFINHLQLLGVIEGEIWHSLTLDERGFIGRGASYHFHNNIIKPRDFKFNSYIDVKYKYGEDNIFQVEPLITIFPDKHSKTLENKNLFA